MQWNEIKSEQDLQSFLELFGNFHDSCLKEMRYISGAYVGEDLAMNPINNQRKLYVVLQRQYRDMTTVEIEFSGLVKLNLAPCDEGYTCEILDAAMFFEDGLVYWADSENFTKQRTEYDGTWLCAKKAAWRVVEQ